MKILILLLLFINLVIGVFCQNDSIINTEAENTSNSSVSVVDIPEATDVPRVEASVTDVNNDHKEWCYNNEKLTYEECSNENSKEENKNYGELINALIPFIVLFVIIFCCIWYNKKTKPEESNNPSNADNFNNRNLSEDDILPEYKEVENTNCISIVIEIPSTTTNAEATNDVASENCNYHLPTYEETMANSNSN